MRRGTVEVSALSSALVPTYAVTQAGSSSQSPKPRATKVLSSMSSAISGRSDGSSRPMPSHSGWLRSAVSRLSSASSAISRMVASLQSASQSLASILSSRYSASEVGRTSAAGRSLLKFSGW